MAKQKDDKRPTAKEYLQQMKDLQNQMFKLDMIVVTRLYTLCASHPNAPISVMIDNNLPECGSVEIKAKSLIPATMGKRIINDLSFETRIQYIEAIEKYIANKHPHKQLDIEYKPQINID